jgi:hypothetical protein
MESQLARLLRRMALLEAGIAVDQVQGSHVMQAVFAKVDKRTELERSLRRILQGHGSRAFTSATRRTARSRTAEVTDARMREFMRTKEVRLQQIMRSVRNDVRASVRTIIADAIEEVPRPSTGEIARRIRTAFAGAPGGQPLDVEDRVFAPRTGQPPPRGLPAPARQSRVLPTERFRTTEGGHLYAFSPERAALIARTEMAQAENEGIVEGYKQTGVKGLKWLAYRDGRAGERRHNEMHGKVTRVGEPFVLPTGRGRHYPTRTIRWPGDSTAPISETANCFPGNTAVLSPAVRHAMRRPYRGELVTLAVKDRGSVTCTPNHPVLTRRGWVRADEVRIADDQIGCIGEVARNWLRRCGHDIDARPRTLSEIFESFPEGHRLKDPVPFDFYGDVAEGDVEIVGPYRKLTNGIETERDHARADLLLAWPRPIEALLLRARAFLQFSLSPLLATDGVMSGTGEAGAFFLGGLPHPLVHSGRAPSYRDVGSVEYAADGGAGPPGADGDGFDAFASHVAFHDVIDCSVRQEVAGHVYTLDTILGWYATANTVVVKNCRCTVAPVLLDEELE